jgi:hypothetical protein
VAINSACHLLSRWFLARLLFFDPEDGGDVPPKRRLTLNGLHGVISRKIVLFKRKVVRRSLPLAYIRQPDDEPNQAANVSRHGLYDICQNCFAVKEMVMEGAIRTAGRWEYGKGWEKGKR